MSFRTFILRLQKKTLFDVLDRQIEEAHRIGKKLDFYKTTLDGEADWFERVCRERIEKTDKKKGKAADGTCTNSTVCHSTP